MRTVLTNSEVLHLYAQWPRREQHHARNPGHSLWFDSYSIVEECHPTRKGEIIRHAHGHNAYAGTENYPGRIATLGDHVSRLFSYRTCIAMMGQREGQIYALVTTRTYSITTSSKHMPRGAFPPEVTVFHVDDCGAVNDEAHRANIEKMIREAGESAKKVKRARVHGEWHKEQSERRLAEARSYAVFFGVDASDLLPDNLDWAQVAERVREADAIAKAEREEAARARQAEDAKKFEQWRDGEIQHCPASYCQHASGTSRLRIRPDGDWSMCVETSEGARVSIEDATRALDIVERLKARGKSVDISEEDTRVGHYRLDKIKSDGRIHIGCHSIEWAEIERIAPDLRRLSQTATA